jgi:hypothetical protein
MLGQALVAFSPRPSTTWFGPLSAITCLSPPWTKARQLRGPFLPWGRGQRAAPHRVALSVSVAPGFPPVSGGPDGLCWEAQHLRSCLPACPSAISLECAVPRFRALSPLECAVTEKGGGVPIDLFFHSQCFAMRVCTALRVATNVALSVSFGTLVTNGLIIQLSTTGMSRVREATSLCT